MKIINLTSNNLFRIVYNTIEEINIDVTDNSWELIVTNIDQNIERNYFRIMVVIKLIL